jgi:hypothetical protein
LGFDICDEPLIRAATIGDQASSVKLEPHIAIHSTHISMARIDLGYGIVHGNFRHLFVYVFGLSKAYDEWMK